MNNQKDKKTLIEKKEVLVRDVSHQNIHNYYNVSRSEQYKSLSLHAQKILSAVCMISDFLPEDNRFRSLIPNRLIDITDHLFELTYSDTYVLKEKLSRVYNMSLGVLSYFQVIYDNRMISDMNYEIIFDQLTRLRNDVRVEIDLLTSESLYKSLPNIDLGSTFIKKDQIHKPQKDTSTHTNAVVSGPVHVVSKRNDMTTLKASNVLVQNTTLKNSFTSKKSNTPKKETNSAKDIRQENIRKILKQKKDASINDICLLFKNCSSKTIQRDLAEMIAQGIVVKDGSRRWSKYNLA